VKKSVPGSPKSVLPPGRAKMSRYLISIERTSTGFSAYSPDLPGCVATGATREELEKEMHGTIEFHLEGLRLGSWCRRRR